MLSATSLDYSYNVVLDNLGQLGQHYFTIGQLAAALAILERGVDLPGAARASPSSIQFLLTYGHTLLWQSSLITGNYQRSLAVLRDAVERAETHAESALLARAYDELGFCHYQHALTGSRDFQDAARYFQHAHTLWEQEQNIAGMCLARFHRGLIAERARQFEQAVAHFTWVAATAREHNLPAYQAETSRHLGFAAMRAADYPTALTAFQEALTLTKGHRSRLFLPFAHAAVAEAYQVQKQYAEARHHYEHAAALATKFGVNRARVQIL